MKMGNTRSPWCYDAASNPAPRGPNLAVPCRWFCENSLRSYLVGRIASAVAHRMNDDFSVRRLVEDEIWVRRRRDAPNGAVIGYRASQRIPHKQIGDRANSGVDARGSLRG